MTDKYDLMTARGVLLALADGHQLNRGDGTLSVHIDRLEWLSESGLTRDYAILFCPDSPWKIAPEHVNKMGVRELARELLGESAVAVQNEHSGHWVAWSRDTEESVAAQTEDDLAKRLRVLVRAKRAREL